MIIVSSRKFRDSQNEYFEIALEEEVILKTLHYGNFKLVPIKEQAQGKKKRGRPSKISQDAVYIPEVKAESISEVSVSQSIEPKKAFVPLTTIEQITQSTEVESKQEETTRESVKNTESAMDFETRTQERANTVIQEKDTEIQEEDVLTITGTNLNEPPTKENLYTSVQEKANKEISEENKIKETLLKETSKTLVDNELNTTQKQEEIHVEKEWKPGNVFVDPSLLSLEETRIQEGLEFEENKGGIFSKLFRWKK